MGKWKKENKRKQKIKTKGVLEPQKRLRYFRIYSSTMHYLVSPWRRKPFHGLEYDDTNSVLVWLSITTRLPSLHIFAELC